MSESKYQNKNILLHACCAVCVSYPYFQLKEMGFNVIIYFYNPNIYPETEYSRRLDELKNFSEINNAELIIEETSYEYWLDLVKGFEKEPEKGKRCSICFKERLSKTIKKAVELECDYFTTTLSVSPHKNSKQIFEVAKNSLSEFSSDSKLQFLEIDFKKQNGFIKTSKLADKYGFYRQKYCGCEFSIRTT